MTAPKEEGHRMKKFITAAMVTFSLTTTMLCASEEFNIKNMEDLTKCGGRNVTLASKEALEKAIYKVLPLTADHFLQNTKLSKELAHQEKTIVGVNMKITYKKFDYVKSLGNLFSDESFLTEEMKTNDFSILNAILNAKEENKD